MALGGRGLPRRGCASCHRATLPHKKYRVASEALDAEPVDYLADVTDKTIRQHGHRLTTLRANAYEGNRAVQVPKGELVSLRHAYKHVAVVQRAETLHRE